MVAIGKAARTIRYRLPRQRSLPSEVQVAERFSEKRIHEAVDLVNGRYMEMDNVLCGGNWAGGLRMTMVP